MQSTLNTGLAASMQGLRAKDDPQARYVAAIVYANEAYPNALFRQLVEACGAAGIATAGVLQHAASADSNHRCDVYLQDLASGYLTRLFENRGSEARGCRLDGAALADATARIEKSLEAEPGLLLLNKFGKAECEGEGMRELIASAMLREIPVAIGVPVRNLEAWREFAGEFAVELPADFVSVLHWLSTVRTGGAAQGLSSD
jgi:Protein of unknown function (DUF2478)